MGQKKRKAQRKRDYVWEGREMCAVRKKKTEIYVMGREKKTDTETQIR